MKVLDGIYSLPYNRNQGMNHWKRFASHKMEFTLHNFQNPKYLHRVLIVGAIALAWYILSDGDALAKCEQRMSREVCLHSLYP